MAYILFLEWHIYYVEKKAKQKTTGCYNTCAGK
jgi:hypothetical protein